ncbi:MAG: hypothetical protein EA417_18755 [Gammaproteobacteria bacterium]|nr:MAG: hypothetical protein EA417_18755 [Gammaproteobacteria bacterium]
MRGIVMLSLEPRTVALWAALLTVTVTAVGQICLKHGVNLVQFYRVAQPAERAPWESVWALGTNPFVLGGIGLYGASTLLWIFVLSRLPLSQAYPFVGLSIVITSVFGALLLGERLSPGQVLGIVMVSAGVLLVVKA